MELRKRPNFWLNQQDLFTTFSKIFQAIEGTIIWWSFLATDLSQRFLNTKITCKTFQQFKKIKLLNRSANMYQSSVSKFLRTTTGI